jgi:ABC-type Fe3+/spermidine/putrescine transport system ATPase subunit
VDGRVLSDNRGVVPPEHRGMGMVFQSYAVWPHMTVFNNVAFGLRLRRWAREAIRQKVQTVLELVNMAEYAARYPTQLSGGQQQRVAIARALVNRPSVLFADEPTGNLDSRTSEEVLRMFQQLNDENGITIILVTHDPSVAQHAREIIRIHDGLIVSRSVKEAAGLPAPEDVATGSLSQTGGGA